MIHNDLFNLGEDQYIFYNRIFYYRMMSMVHNDIFNLGKNHEHDIFSIIEFSIME